LSTLYCFAKMKCPPLLSIYLLYYWGKCVALITAFSGLRTAASHRSFKIQATDGAGPISATNTRKQNIFQDKDDIFRRQPKADDRSEQKRRQRHHQPQKKREPWRASFRVSKQTQQKIKQAAAGSASRKPIQRASSILQTLLETPAERCNCANLVCALTLSAKEVVSGGLSSQGECEAAANYRALLLKSFDILHDLVIHLSTRQCCNAIWAIAKHYERDPLLLPESTKTASAYTSHLVEAEARYSHVGGSSDKAVMPSQLNSIHKLDVTIDAIARQLTVILNTENKSLKLVDFEVENRKGNSTAQRETKIGEICMASWAYGVLRPRRRPPGWLAPPQMGKVPEVEGDQRQHQQHSKRKNDFITLEQWTLNDDDLSCIDPGAASLELGDAADELFDAISEALCRPARIESCTWSEIANVPWAFEKRGCCLSSQSEMLLRALAREAGSRLRAGGSQTRHMISRDISQLIWALGALQQDNFRLSHDLVVLIDDFSYYLGLENAEEASRPFENWSCPDIVQIVLSLAHARIDKSRLLIALFEESNRRLSGGIVTSTESYSKDARKTFLPWEVSVMLWAQARLFLTSANGAVYLHFPHRATRCIDAEIKGGSLGKIFRSQEQANIAWALTVLQHYDTKEAVSVLREIFREAAKGCKENGIIQLEHAHQLWQALFLLEEASPSSVAMVPGWFRGYLGEKWDAEKSRSKASSARHRSISQLLNLMGVSHHNEHDEDIDVALSLKGQATWTHQTNTEGERSAKKIAVEFDGPMHFTRQARPLESVRALGHTVLKYRLLKQKGWTVVRVPYYEFDKVRKQ